MPQGSLFSSNKEFFRQINARTVTSPVAVLVYLYDLLTEKMLMPIANAAMRNIKTCFHSAIKAIADEITPIRNCGADIGFRIMNAIIALPTNIPKQNTMARFILFCL